jgi:hypothetical protein
MDERRDGRVLWRRVDVKDKQAVRVRRVDRAGEDEAPRVEARLVVPHEDGRVGVEGQLAAAQPLELAHQGLQRGCGAGEGRVADPASPRVRKRALRSAGAPAAASAPRSAYNEQRSSPPLPSPPLPSPSLACEA